MTADRTAARARGGLIGASTAITGTAGHALGHGALPGTDALILLVLTGGALGLATAGARRPGRLLLPALLLAGQALAHLVLALTGGGHHELLPGLSMAAAHVAAAALAAVLVAGLETAILGLLRRLIPLLEVALGHPPVGPSRLAVPTVDGPRPDRPGRGPGATRAPPLPV
ncbi:hypothetical protein GP2_023_00050 [Gordonia paraffinivorans NBRC 108238]|uniref:MFS transporter n=1 Tax=Gordonia paraffinivorans NBRC 108238 TaxID=1223543 RepID=A0ABQ0ILP5_9ACTN|nr:hypothetical protein [Gordonia paraffinivorans]GAC84482.1 hypothetical protein GP2_023_00050 [Gordonia paraffinivorans NBRC 108238]